MTAPLRRQREGAVLTLTLDRAEKRNALSQALIAELHAALAEVDDAIAVVVLRGAGKDFCAGADLEELLASADRTPEENEAEALRLGRLFLALGSCPAPVVAVVHGRALAGGCGLAAACDLVLARDDARFGYPEVLRGFVPAMVMAQLRRLVGPRAAYDLAATGRVIGADEARALGLVTRVLPADGFDAAADAAVAELAATSRSAQRFLKRLVHDLDGLDLEQGIALGARVNAAARATPDFRAALRQFLDR
ncbi:MAG: enoyl-CoA hydratase/isomerase family protein [Gemmatimonadales bacterium]|nr:enoyl-CoA hydratase/isomerase family protein [Gemmatimonadales bacterium]